jgi:hypothetical protein
MMLSMVRPVDGSMGDWMLWKTSGVIDYLRPLLEVMAFQDRYHCFDDPAYYGGFEIMGAYRTLPGEPLTQEKNDFS